MDIDELLATTANSFVFDDPVEPGPVSREMLSGYMQRWDQRTRAMGSTNQWNLSHHLRQDNDGILTDSTRHPFPGVKKQSPKTNSGYCEPYRVVTLLLRLFHPGN